MRTECGYPVVCFSSTWGGWRILKMTFVRVRKIYANFLFYFHFYSMNIIIYFKLFHFGVKSCVLRVSISSCSVWNDCGAWHGKKTRLFTVIKIKLFIFNILCKQLRFCLSCHNALQCFYDIHINMIIISLHSVLSTIIWYAFTYNS